MQRIYGSERLEINIQTKSLEKIWNTMDDLIRLSFDLGQATLSVVMRRKPRRRSNDASRLVVFMQKDEGVPVYLLLLS